MNPIFMCTHVTTCDDKFLTFAGIIVMLLMAFVVFFTIVEIAIKKYKNKAHKAERTAPRS